MKTLCLILPLLLASLTLVGAPAPTPTTFAYQGRLADGGAGADGLYDFRFELFPNHSDPTPSLGTVFVETALVVDGVFNVELDFGDAFDGTPRYLELQVRRSNRGESYTLLRPRQRLALYPQAVFASHAGVARNVQDGAIHNGSLRADAVKAENISSGEVVKSLNGLRDDVTLAAGANITLTHSGNSLRISAAPPALAGDGSGLTGLNASALATGTVPEGRLGPGIARLAADQHFTGINTFAHSIGVGTAFPGERLELQGQDATALLHDNDSDVLGFVGNTENSLQLGLLNNSPFPIGGFLSGDKRSSFAMDSVGRVGSVRNNFGPPQWRNLLDDGRGNAQVAGTMTARAFVGDGSGLRNVSAGSLTGPLSVEEGAVMNVNHWESASFPVPGIETIHVRDVAVANGVAYVGLRLGAMYLIDLRIPNPVPVRSETSGQVTRILAYGNRLFVGTAGSGVQVLDISIPMRPVEVGRYSYLGTILDLEVLGDRLFAIVGSWGFGSDDALYVIDISNAANPTRSRRIPGLFSQMVAFRQFLYVGTMAPSYHDDGLTIFDISDPDNATPAGRVALAEMVDISPFPFLAGGCSLTLAQNRLAVGHSHPGGLTILDVSDPVRPTVAGRVGTSALVLAGQSNQIWAMLSSGESGTPESFVLLDITEPANPTELFRRADLDVESATIVGDDLWYGGNFVGALRQRRTAVSVSAESSVNFGRQTRQILNLWDRSYGVGVQHNTEYFRSNWRFSWFRGGSHVDAENDPGPDGRVLMTLDPAGLTVNGTFVSTSDRDAKTGFAPVNPHEVLEKVAAMPMSRWSYKDDPGTAHIGPVAQDFRAAFGLGADDKHISMVDADGVALTAIQGLHALLKDKDGRLAAQEAELRALKSRLDRLEADRTQEQ